MDDVPGNDCVVCGTKGDNCDQQHPSCGACDRGGVQEICSYDWDITNPRVMAIFQPQPRWDDRLGKFREDPSLILGGTCGVVYRVADKDGGVVAVKVTFNDTNTTAASLKLCLKQAWRWKGLKHKNIAPLLGVTNFNEIAVGGRRQICFISPWREEGNIMQYLERHPGAKKLNLLTDVVAGLSYLHEQDPPMIHGDLRGSNVLIQMEDEYAKAVLTDFGISPIVQYYYEKYDQDSTYVPKFGNPRWLAFERVRPWDYDHKDSIPVPTMASDVFELSRTFLEVLSGQPPFYYISDSAVRSVRLLVIEEWKTPDRPACQEIDDDWWLLMERGWSRRLEDRPTLTEIRLFLRTATLRANQKLEGPTRHASNSTAREPRVEAHTDVGWRTWLSLARWRKALS